MEAAHSNEAKPRYVETRIMVEGQIIPVGGWFGSWVDDSTAIRILRTRYCPQQVDIRRMNQIGDEKDFELN